MADADAEACGNVDNINPQVDATNQFSEVIVVWSVGGADSSAQNAVADPTSLVAPSVAAVAPHAGTETLAQTTSSGTDTATSAQAATDATPAAYTKIAANPPIPQSTTQDRIATTVYLTSAEATLPPPLNDTAAALLTNVGTEAGPQESVCSLPPPLLTDPVAADETQPSSAQPSSVVQPSQVQQNYEVNLMILVKTQGCGSAFFWDSDPAVFSLWILT